MAMDLICAAATLDLNPIATLAGSALGAGLTVGFTVWISNRGASRIRHDEAAEIRKMLATLGGPAAQVRMPGQDGYHPAQLSAIVGALSLRGERFRRFAAQALEWSRELRFSERAAIMQIIETLDQLDERMAYFAEPMAAPATEQQALIIMSDVIRIAVQCRELTEALGGKSGQAIARRRLWPPRLFKSEKHGNTPPA